MPSPPYPTAEYVLNQARVRINDAGLSLAGNLLSDTQPYTLTYVNTAYQKLQAKLVENGVENFIKETQLLNVTPIAVNDPGVQVYINWANYFDGVTLQAAPVLPQDLIIPLRLWERQNGTNQLWQEMWQAEDGLPSSSQGNRLRLWDWRQDAIYMPGAVIANDLRMRYDAFLPDIALLTDPIKIMLSANAMACYVAEIFANARGSPAAQMFATEGDGEVERMADRTAKRKQRRSIRRRMYGSDYMVTRPYIR